MIEFNESDRDKLITAIYNSYISSSDFNGLPVYEFESKTSFKYEDSVEILRELIKDELICVLDSNTDINPHIIRRGFEPIEIQWVKITNTPDSHLCFYPSKKYLERCIDKTLYASKPYNLYLVLGNAQLSYRSFEISVLERFRNDPRYYYTNNDISGSIFFNEGNAPNDKTMLETFGFSYNESFDRAVAVFICYLAELSPEQQMYWKSYELEGNYRLHPDYYNSSILGNWPEREPICDAILEEIDVINKMCQLMKRPTLFHDSFRGENRPQNFSFLIRPTLKEFNDFIHTFDKLLSDNINKKFFLNDIEYDSIDDNGQKHQKGTIILLEEWFAKFFKPQDIKPLEDEFATIREIRKQRQKPAHTIQADNFDQKYFKEQRQLLINGYSTVRTFRQSFYNHPLVRNSIDIPEWLFEGKIWDI